MNPSDLYEKLQEIERLEYMHQTKMRSKSWKNNVGLGNEEVGRYNLLIESVSRLSVDDIIRYNMYLKEKIRKETMEELREGILKIWEKYQ